MKDFRFMGYTPIELEGFILYAKNHDVAKLIVENESLRARVGIARELLELIQKDTVSRHGIVTAITSFLEETK